MGVVSELSEGSPAGTITPSGLQTSVRRKKEERREKKEGGIEEEGGGGERGIVNTYKVLFPTGSGIHLPVYSSLDT